MAMARRVAAEAEMTEAEAAKAAARARAQAGRTQPSRGASRRTLNSGFGASFEPASASMSGGRFGTRAPSSPVSVEARTGRGVPRVHIPEPPR